MSVVLKASELEALKRRTLTGKMVLGGDSTSAESDALRRTERKAASLEKSAKWGDTLLAQRQAKEDARRKREEDLEAARLVIDKEVRSHHARELRGARSGEGWERRQCCRYASRGCAGGGAARQGTPGGR